MKKHQFDEDEQQFEITPIRRKMRHQFDADEHHFDEDTNLTEDNNINLMKMTTI